MINRREGSAMTEDELKKMKQKQQIDQWQKEHIKRVVVKLNKESDKDILDYLGSLPNVQGYIKSLIRKDIEQNQQ